MANILQDLDISHHHNLRRTRTTNLRRPRRCPLPLSFLRRHLSWPIPRVRLEESESGRGNARGLLLRTRVPVQRGLLPASPTQQTTEHMGAGRGGSKQRGSRRRRVNRLPCRDAASAAQGYLALLYSGEIWTGRAQEAGVAQAGSAIGHPVLHNPGECTLCLRSYSRERLQVASALSGLDHPESEHLQTERHPANGNGGRRQDVF